MESHGKAGTESFYTLVVFITDNVEFIFITESTFVTTVSDGSEISVESRIHGKASDSRSPVITANLLKRKWRLRFII